MKNKGLVSVVIPFFNSQGYLDGIMSSILRQSYTNWELILVDDGSMDESQNIALSYAQKDDRIKVYSRTIEPKGASTCRNIGIEKAVGEFIVFLDADDLIANYCFEQRVQYMNQNLDCDFAVFPLIAFKKQLLDVDDVVMGYKQEGKILSNFIRRTLPFVVVTNIYRRDAILTHSLFWDTKLKSFQDSDYNIDAICKHCVFKISNFPPDYYWRIEGNANSISKRIISREHFESHLYFFDKLLKKIEEVRKYRSDFLIFSNLLFKIALFNLDANCIDNYSSHSFFSNYPILKRKLILISCLKRTFGLEKHIYLNILMLILCPLYEVRYRSVFMNWNLRKKKLFRELVKIYNDEICS